MGDDGGVQDGYVDEFVVRLGGGLDGTREKGLGDRGGGETVVSKTNLKGLV